jgi:N-acetylglucosaminyldiphosphoundecaprenol N-acetyl-beta-D-mannosaminyltransferase
MRPQPFIFGTRIDNISSDEIIHTVHSYLQKGSGFHHIATVNAEILLKAHKDALFRDILNRCDLNVADSIGLNLAFWKKGERLQARIPGADLMEYILRYAERHHLKVCCVIRRDGLSSADSIRSSLFSKYPNLKVSLIIMNHFWTVNNISKIGKGALYSSQIVLCNFGAPYQETFLGSLRNQSGNIRLTMGIGGSLDYLTGILPRAPLWIRRVGLEWLWRLIQQPKRWKRIWNAVVAFPLRVFLEK